MISGRVWKFGDNINTDLMLPGAFLFASEAEQMRVVFSANRPGWVDAVRPGDIIIGGTNFGTGSNRPAIRSFRNLGIAAIIAESISSLFFRDCVNYGMIALECPGIAAAFAEGDTARVSLDDFTVRNARSDVTLAAVPVPDRLLSVMRGGGVFPLLEAEGVLSPPRQATAATDSSPAPVR